MSPQAMYFLDTTLTLNDSKQLSQVSDQVLDKSDVRIRRKWPKMAKIGHFWPKSQKREFFSKIQLEHFFRLIKM